MQTRAESSVTRKSEHLKTSLAAYCSWKSVTAGLGSDLEKEMLLMVYKFNFSNQATTLNWKS